MTRDSRFLGMHSFKLTTKSRYGPANPLSPPRFPEQVLAHAGNRNPESLGDLVLGHPLEEVEAYDLPLPGGEGLVHKLEHRRHDSCRPLTATQPCLNVLRCLVVRILFVGILVEGALLNRNFSEGRVGGRPAGQHGLGLVVGSAQVDTSYHNIGEGCPEEKNTVTQPLSMGKEP